MNSVLYPMLLENISGSLSFISKVLANALILYVIGKVLHYIYQEHSYLYQFDSNSSTLDKWISLILPYVKKLKFPKYRAYITQKLNLAAIKQGWTSDHFLAYQIIYISLGIAIGYVFFVILLNLSLFFALALGAFFFAITLIKLTEQANYRQISCTKNLPYFIDYVSLAMDAGLNFNQALERVVFDAPQSPLTQEFSIVLRNINLGMSKEQALIELQKRIDIPEIRLFTQTMIQAIKLGSDVVQTLRVISENLQTKRFQRAEENAGKISVKMLIPMMVFVLPATMIILLGPIMLEWLMVSF